MTSNQKKPEVEPVPPVPVEPPAKPEIDPRPEKSNPVPVIPEIQPGPVPGPEIAPPNPNKEGDIRGMQSEMDVFSIQ